MPQTLSEIRLMLEEAGLRPQKMFGQNFLIDHNLLGQLVDLAAVRPDDVVLEVGPGTGTLTERLLETGAQVLAVEIDRGLAELLERRLGGQPNFRLIQADVLAGKHAINPQVLDGLRSLGQPVNLVSNLPYNIATSLVCECLLTSASADRGDLHGVRFERLTFTVQREVTQRLAASAGDEFYGQVSVLVSLMGSTTIGRDLPAEAFWPRPNVTSRMMRIDVHPPGIDILPDVDELLRAMALVFGQRRKQIGSAARRRGSRYDPETFAAALEKARIDPTSRPEQLTSEAFAALARALAGK